MSPECAARGAAHAGGLPRPEGDAIRFTGPGGAMTSALAADLSKHKMLFLAVFKMIVKPRTDAAWETVREWIPEGKPGPAPPAIIAAGEAIGLLYGERGYPPVYEERLRMSLRARDGGRS